MYSKVAFQQRRVGETESLIAVTTLDYLVIAVVMVSSFFGLVRGIVRTTISLAATLAGLIVAARSYSYVGQAITLLGVPALLANVLAFAAVFLAVAVAGSVIAHILRGTLAKMKLAWLDHLLGGGFGFLRGWLFCSALYLVFTAFPVLPGSMTRTPLTPLLRCGTVALSYLTPAALRQRFMDGYDSLAASPRRASGRAQN